MKNLVRLPPLRGEKVMANCQEGSGPEVGKYLGRWNKKGDDSGVACPWCAGPLIVARPIGTAGRIVRLYGRKRGSSRMALVQRVPETHEVLACIECSQAFTRPINQS